MHDLVIFDCDGVLIDSEIIACRIEAEELSAAGFAYDAAEIARRFVGLAGGSMYALIEAEHGRPVPEALRLGIGRRMREAVARELAAVPGVREALAEIAWPVCVASSSGLDYLALALGTVGLYERFRPHVYSGQQVARPKPAPDLFLFAAARLDARPAATVVIEDSLAGVEAGRAAGMRVLGFCGGGHCAPGHAERLVEAGAERVFAEMRELPALLRAL